MNTDELIKSIEDWKAKKDGIEYQKKVVEENKVHALLEQMNGTIIKEIKDILKLQMTLVKCGVGYETKDYSKPRFLCSADNYYFLYYRFHHCECRIFEYSQEFSFLGLDSNGYSTGKKSNPPESYELKNFMQNFDEFKKSFYDFINKTLKS